MTTPMDLDGPASPPRTNGELDFAEPWESRAFGIAVTLYEAGLFGWPQFKEALIARIARWEAAPTEGWSFYGHWLGALQDVLASCGVVLPDDVTARGESLAQRPTGHDHVH